MDSFGRNTSDSVWILQKDLLKCKPIIFFFLLKAPIPPKLAKPSLHDTEKCFGWRKVPIGCSVTLTRRRGWSWRTCKACPTVSLKPPAVSYTDAAVRRHELLEPHPSPTPTTQKNRRSLRKIHTNPDAGGIVEADNMQLMNIVTNHFLPNAHYTLNAY